MIRVTDIHKRYGDLEVLKGVSLEVAQGEVVSIVGASGAGKTTLLQIMGTLSRPDGGRVEIDGQDVSSLGDRALSRFRNAHIGFVFQSFNLIDELNVFENVELPLIYLRVKASERKRRVNEILSRMNISHRAEHFPQQLSGGQQQRVAIARALALHPDILCFDEPTSALDPELTGEVLKVLRDLADRKTTMIIVTHEMHFARDVADRILFMDGGVVVEEGPAKQLIDHPREERTRQFLAHYSE